MSDDKGVEGSRKNANRINILAQNSGAKEISARQGTLDLQVERDIGGIGMGVLSDGTPYLNQRGLALLCGVQNAHIGTITSQWSEREQKPRITAIKSILAKSGAVSPVAHYEIVHNGRTHFCYPADVCLAVLEYYAFDAGQNCQPEARDNFRLLAGSKLREMIYSQVGYDPSGRAPDKFRKWHERIALNYQSAPKVYSTFSMNPIQLYMNLFWRANIGEKFVIDISNGTFWSKHWVDNSLSSQYGDRCKYPHGYPDDHPQAKSNPQESWCYPLSALGYFREWMQDSYIEGGKFSAYLSNKVRRGELPPSVAQLAITAIVPTQIEGLR